VKSDYRHTVSPSVSIKAASTPSCDVPLISPIDKTDADCVGRSNDNCAAMHAFFGLNHAPDLIHQRRRRGEPRL
jgi:hypothetical protein